MAGGDLKTLSRYLPLWANRSLGLGGQTVERLERPVKGASHHGVPCFDRGESPETPWISSASNRTAPDWDGSASLARIPGAGQRLVDGGVARDWEDNLGGNTLTGMPQQKK